MRVLVACEYSGTVRDAFIAAGHEAVSCDLLPTEKPGPHIQGDAVAVLDYGWDLLIAHPPCKYLSGAGNGVINYPGRKEKREDAFRFFMRFMEAPIKKICVENPVGYVNSHYKKPSQIIHPWFFGEPEFKRTCLWLKNLPPLWFSLPGEIFLATGVLAPTGQKFMERVRKHYSTKRRAHVAAKTFQSIADAMASQWGKPAYEVVNEVLIT